MLLQYVRVIRSLVGARQSVPFVFPFVVIKSVLVQLNGVYVLHHGVRAKADFLAFYSLNLHGQNTTNRKLPLPPSSEHISERYVQFQYKKMPASELNGSQVASSSVQSAAAAVSIPQVIPHNSPLPSPMSCNGDVAGNWDFFRQQWSDYEIATGLDK